MPVCTVNLLLCSNVWSCGKTTITILIQIQNRCNHDAQQIYMYCVTALLPQSSVACLSICKPSRKFPFHVADIQRFRPPFFIMSQWSYMNIGEPTSAMCTRSVALTQLTVDVLSHTNKYFPYYAIYIASTLCNQRKICESRRGLVCWYTPGQGDEYSSCNVATTALVMLQEHLIRGAYSNDLLAIYRPPFIGLKVGASYFEAHCLKSTSYLQSQLPKTKSMDHDKTWEDQQHVCSLMTYKFFSKVFHLFTEIY
jgi:hypothetical protein